MPMPNDLSPEEEQLFSQHGVASVGAGGEPVQELVQQEPTPHEQMRDEQGRFIAQPPVQEPAEQPQQEGEPPQEQPQQEQPQQAPPQGFVPHAALHAERERAKELARQNQMLIARTNAILAAQAPTQPPALPSLEADPVAYVQHIGNTLQEMQQRQAEESHTRQIDAAISNDEAAFSAYTPDYEQASEFFLRSRVQELTAMGYAGQQIQQTLFNEARQMAQEAWRRGSSLGQTVYAMAHARGYRSQPATGVPAQFAQQPGQPPVQTPVTGSPPAQGLTQPTPAQQVAAIRQGQQGSRTLSGGAGAPPNVLNAQALLNMSDEEFAAHLGIGTDDKAARQRFERVAGA